MVTNSVHTCSWWPTVYIRNFLTAYSVDIPPNINLNPKSTTSSWLSLYTINFYGLFCSFSSPWWANLFLRDIFWPCARISADWFCTRNFLTAYSVHLPPRVDLLLLCTTYLWRCLWCSRYRRRKWARRYEFKSLTRLIAFHIALIPLGKVWIQ